MEHREKLGTLYKGGLQTLTRPAVATAPESAPILLGTWESKRPMPMEVALSADLQLATAPLFPVPYSTCLAGCVISGFNNDAFNSGYFKLEYGFGALQRTRILDLRPARIFLGVCDSVRITAQRWLGTQAWPASTFNALNCSAAIGPAVGGAYDELVSSQQLFCASGAPVSNFFVPPAGATHAEFSVAPIAITSLWGSAQPDLLIQGTEQVLYRWASNAVVPPFRRIPATWGSNIIATTNGTNVTTDIVVTGHFFLNS